MNVFLMYVWGNFFLCVCVCVSIYVCVPPLSLPHTVISEKNLKKKCHLYKKAWNWIPCFLCLYLYHFLLKRKEYVKNQKTKKNKQIIWILCHHIFCYIFFLSLKNILNKDTVLKTIFKKKYIRFLQQWGEGEQDPPPSEKLLPLYCSFNLKRFPTVEKK